jgi:1D-myo-inositol 3-kinase
MSHVAGAARDVGHRRTGRNARVDTDLHFDYTTLGHVTIDVLADGSRRPGGTAFYSGLQAARLGRRTLIVTRGRADELEELLEPYRGELELEILPAPHTTTLLTSGSGSERRQRVLAWAGPLTEDIAVDTSILHLAPVAREIPARWRGPAAFVGLTPQGLVREWSEGDGEVSLPAATEAGADAGSQRPGDGAPPGRGAADALGIAGRCDAIVVSEEERPSCAGLIAAAAGAGAVVAVTAGPWPNTILLPQGGVLQPAVPAVEDPRDDLGAGDVFAAAFFCALAEGRSPDGAAAFANAAAAVRMQGAGPGAIGERAAIEARLHAGAGSPS